MLKLENELRLSKEVQAAYRAYVGTADEQLAVTDAVQRRVAAQFGFRTDAEVEAAVIFIRTAQHAFAGDKEHTILRALQPLSPR